MEEPLNFLSALPNDALYHAVSFLDSKEALQLPVLNSSFRETLSLSSLHNPTPMFVRNTWYGARDETGNTPRRSVWIPVLFPNRTHSIVLTCRWRDQGYGNRKGGLFVVAVDTHDDPNATTLESIENGKIVYESPLAPHEEQSLQMSFSYSPSKAYYLWYRVGGGGGHQLRVHNLEMHTIIHDSPGQWIGRNYKALHSQGFVQDNNTFSLGMLRLIAQLGQEENTPESRLRIAAFFGATGFDMSEASMKALEEIATALLANDLQEEAHAALAQNHNENRGHADNVPFGHGVRVLAGGHIEMFDIENEPEFVELLGELPVMDLHHVQNFHMPRLPDEMIGAMNQQREGMHQAMDNAAAAAVAIAENFAAAMHGRRGEMDRAVQAAVQNADAAVADFDALIPEAMAMMAEYNDDDEAEDDDDLSDDEVDDGDDESGEEQ